MRYFPDADDDEARRINARPWMMSLLQLNPSYLGWGPHEDYMSKEGESWDSRIIIRDWQEFASRGLELDCFNECVNFYFDVQRENKQCPACFESNGYHPRAQRVVNTFYAHQCVKIGASKDEVWKDAITQDEVQALVDEGRLIDFTHDFHVGEGWKKKEPAYVPTAEEVNAWAKASRAFVGHDAINRAILTRARLERLGLPLWCETCEGYGYVHVEEGAHVSLILWVLHPRQGCSRGIEISRIDMADLPSIQAFLAEAAKRNAERFEKIGGITSVLIPGGTA